MNTNNNIHRPIPQAIPAVPALNLFEPVHAHAVVKTQDLKERIFNVFIEALPLIAIVSPEAAILGNLAAVGANIRNSLAAGNKLEALYSAGCGVALILKPVLASQCMHTITAVGSLVSAYNAPTKTDAALHLLRAGYEITIVASIATGNPQIIAVSLVAQTAFSAYRAYSFYQKGYEVEALVNVAVAGVAGNAAYNRRNDLFVPLKDYKAAAVEFKDWVAFRGTQIKALVQNAPAKAQSFYENTDFRALAANTMNRAEVKATELKNEAAVVGGQAKDLASRTWTSLNEFYQTTNFKELAKAKSAEFRDVAVEQGGRAKDLAARSWTSLNEFYQTTNFKEIAGNGLNKVKAKSAEFTEVAVEQGGRAKDLSVKTWASVNEFYETTNFRELANDGLNTAKTKSAAFKDAAVEQGTQVWASAKTKYQTIDFRQIAQDVKAASAQAFASVKEFYKNTSVKELPGLAKAKYNTYAPVVKGWVVDQSQRAAALAQELSVSAKAKYETNAPVVKAWVSVQADRASTVAQELSASAKAKYEANAPVVKAWVSTQSERVATFASNFFAYSKHAYRTSRVKPVVDNGVAQVQAYSPKVQAWLNAKIEAAKARVNAEVNSFNKPNFRRAFGLRQVTSV